MKLAVTAALLVLATGGAGAVTHFNPEASYSDLAPQISPDGTRIAFLREGVTAHHLRRATSLYVVDATGRHAVALTRGSVVSPSNKQLGRFDSAGPMSWSPDGSRIVFARAYVPTRHDPFLRALMIVDADGGHRSTLVPSGFAPYAMPNDPSWSAALDKIAFDGGDGALYVVNPDASGLIRISNDPDPKYDPSWAPDGSQMAVATGGGLALIHADGSRGPFLGLGKIDAGSPSWSPDGKTIAFSAERDSSTLDIYTVALDGSNLRRLTTNPAPDITPAWTPDGKSIVFASGRGRGYLQYSLWIMNADGTQQRPLLRRAVRRAWNGRRCTITGTAAADQLDGTPKPDVLCAGAGNDVIHARDHHRDVVDGGPGRDRAQIDLGLDRVKGVEKILH